MKNSTFTTSVLADLRRVRQKQGLSLSALASASGYSRSYISKIEHGQRLPTFAALFKIYSALGYEIIAREIV